jgi:SAM-dependent methyltransferase
MIPDDLNQLTDDLTNFRAELEAAGVRAELVRSALPRLLATLEMIPETARNGAILELGSSPYFLSICLRRLCRGPITHGNYFGTAEARTVDRLVHQHTGEVLELTSDLFNIETDVFPYPDASFDVVIFSELIEHLGTNPVRTLSEIHRVLKPQGVVVVTTPNAISLHRLETFLSAGSQMVDRYSPLFGYGARHNREYHPAELRTLLESCGFIIEAMTLRDLGPPPFLGWRRAAWLALLRRYGDASRAEHIFLRARRGPRFRWRFPSNLFDNIEFYTLVRETWVEMGINDAIQTAAGWYPLDEAGVGGRTVKWVRDTGQAFLKTPVGFAGVTFDLYAAPAAGAPPVSLHITVWDRWLGRIQVENVYVDEMVSLPRGSWQRVELPMIPGDELKPGDEVTVRISLDPLSQLAHPALAVLPAAQRGVAVHRIAYRTSGVTGDQ